MAWEYSTKPTITRGMHGSAATNYALQEADCIVALGSRFDDRTTGEVSKYAPKCENFNHFNIEETEFNKVVKTENFVISDLRVILPILNDKLKNIYSAKNVDTLKMMAWISTIKKKRKRITRLHTTKQTN